MLPQFKEPRPFASARSVKRFTVSALVAGGCAGALYALLAQGLGKMNAEEQVVMGALHQPRSSPASASPSAPATTGSVVPFESPSYGRLVALARADDAFNTAPQPQAVALPAPPLLHQEATARLVTAWNAGIDALETTATELERQRREYFEASAVEALRLDVVRDVPGYDVTLSVK